MADTFFIFCSRSNNLANKGQETRTTLPVSLQFSEYVRVCLWFSLTQSLNWRTTNMGVRLHTGCTWEKLVYCISNETWSLISREKVSYFSGSMANPPHINGCRRYFKTISNFSSYRSERRADARVRSSIGQDDILPNETEHIRYT